ncbi:MAG: hypothetical protein LBT92_01000 [Rickettsiales bacterium]|nr:hypothetical protein [Rickettsiales bacterium]
MALHLARAGRLRALAEVRGWLREAGFIKINRFYCQDCGRLLARRGGLRYIKVSPAPAAGDVLVVVFGDGNGHCMVVEDILSRTPEEISLRIADSTRFPHRNDTRAEGQTGIGSGEIRLLGAGGKYDVYDAQNPGLPPRKAEIYFLRFPG